MIIFINVGAPGRSPLHRMVESGVCQALFVRPNIEWPHRSRVASCSVAPTVFVGNSDDTMDMVGHDNPGIQLDLVADPCRFQPFLCCYTTKFVQFHLTFIHSAKQ